MSIESIKGSRGKMENLLASIPGFKGYLEKEWRRDADKLLRQHVAQLLDEQRRRIAGLQQQLVTGGKILLLDDLGRAETKLSNLIDRIKTASYGYAGLFDAVKVDEAQLDALYTFDNALIAEAGKIGEAIGSVEAAMDSEAGPASAIKELTATVEGVRATWNKREGAITGAV
jgi:hypothetical protein